MDELHYQSGFANHFETEAMVGALPQGQNSPQKPAFDLYAEQLSGTAFTVPNAVKLRSWLYRILPSVVHGDFSPYDLAFMSEFTHPNQAIPPTQMRWDPRPIPKEPINFIQSLQQFAHNGSPHTNSGATFYTYACNKSMVDEFFYSADGEILIIPVEGELCFRTELGLLTVLPEEIIVIPRGVKFQVQLISANARGYFCENHGQVFCLPERGPIGANGLANERDFLYPKAFYEDKEDSYTLVCKFLNNFWQCQLNHSPLNVVAWHGNYAPYKYDLNKFNTINTVSFDHTDPSIFTVLTSQTATKGVANLDFVIFPPRWMVAEHTFRPPYYHRNIMNELMGSIKGIYDAKPEGFLPGGISLHNCMTPHGPDKNSFEIATKAALKPKYYKENLAFMLESNLCWQPSANALTSDLLQTNYLDCWKSLPKQFKKD